MKKLNNIPKENIFETPQNYFDKLNQNIQNKIAANPKWEWSKETQENIFETPENYFDDLAFQIQTKSQKQRHKKTRIIFIRQLKPILGLTGLITIFVLTFLFWNPLSGSKTEINIAKISKDNKEEVIKENQQERIEEVQQEDENIQHTVKISEKTTIMKVEPEVKKEPKTEDDLEDFLAYEMLLLGENSTPNIEELLENTIQISDVMQVLAWNETDEFLIYEEDLQINESDFDID